MLNFDDKPRVNKNIRLSPDAWYLLDEIRKSFKLSQSLMIETLIEKEAKKQKIKSPKS